MVQGNWLSFQTQVLRDTGYPLPSFVIKECEEYLRFGVLAHGFLRLKCEDCDHEHLVAFSCKRRGFCPSCGGRRMAATAAHLVDSVLPMKPTRQWVLSFPIPIRLCLSARPELTTRLLNITQSTISCYYRAQASLSKSKAMTESVTLIQRFGGSKAKIDSLKSRASNDKKSHAKKSNRIPWANLLKRVFDIDITICPKCRGKVRNHQRH
ncbi:MAG: transposase zinc-binding domain-containing protein [Bdellovibrionales bacterium]|nr:transposase zinc-binding domain-containing protein [Bdellovibrionales bacterium]